MTVFPILGRTIAPVLLLVLPAAAVCAQNAPTNSTPAKSQQARPTDPPTSAPPAQTAPAKTPAADAGTAPSSHAPTEPNRAQAYYHLALAGVYEDDAISDNRTDEVNKAIEEYKLALNADPNSAVLADDLADLYFRVGRVHEAEVTARTLLKSSPDDIDAHKLLGRIYLRELGEGQQASAGGTAPGSSQNQVLDEAIAEFQKIVTLQPKSVEDHMVLGQLYTVKHQPEKAEAEFKTAQGIEPESEDVVLNLARLYAESGDLPHAAKAIEAVPVDGRSPKMEFTLGALYDQMKQPKDAIAAYKRAEDMEPGDLQTVDALAQALLNNDQLDDALKQYKDLAEANPDDAEPLIHIAEIERRVGKYEDALNVVRKARKMDPNSLEAGFNEGLLLDILDRLDEAIKVYQEMVESPQISHANGAYTEEEKNNRSIFLERLGTVCLEENKLDLAIGAYQKMIDLGGSIAVRGYQGEIDAYRGAHEYDKSLDVAKKAVAANPKDRDLKMMLAGELADQGHPDEGLTMAKSLLEGATPEEQRGTWLAIGQINVRLRRWKDAEDALDKSEPLATKKEDRTYLFFMRGELAERQKHYDQAEQYFNQALSLDPENANTLNYLGYMWADKGEKLPEALKMIRKAVDIEPMNGAYRDSLGWVYFKMGEYELAEDNLRQAVNRDQTDPTVHMHLGDLYEKTGRIRLAAAQWQLSMDEFAKTSPADIEPSDVAKVQKKLESAREKLAKEEGALNQSKPE
ncbi:MAG: tetratricopeptide repeat protein [Terracidiphilus sp.]|nr:tetratricopeptide repeat protein [Terracidiphilus sp.]MDR3797500.1 tetratricopeptide repeat protein [Terracidiphilus sp.]